MTVDDKVVLTDKTVGGLVARKVGDMRQERKFNMLIYGDPGVGKTRLACSADEIPEFRKVLYLDIEGGSLSVEDLFPNVERIPVQDFYNLQEIHQDLYDNNGKGYGTVIIDNISELQKVAMERIMRIAQLKDPDIEVEVPRQRDWGVNLEQMRKLVRAFRDLPMHTIITAHAKEDQDNRTGARMVRPSLAGKLGAEIPGFLDLVLYMYVKEGDEGNNIRVVQTGASETHVAKDRSDKLPRFITEPSMAKLYELMKGTVKP